MEGMRKRKKKKKNKNFFIDYSEFLGSHEPERRVKWPSHGIPRPQMAEAQAGAQVDERVEP